MQALSCAIAAPFVFRSHHKDFAVSVRTASNFINFLKAYVPNIDNNAQFDEHVIALAKENSVTPFKFNFTKLEEYKALIDTAVTEKQSKVFLVSGQAGDGKTHFLHSICVDKSLFSMSEEAWQAVTEDTYKQIAINADGDLQLEDCIKISENNQSRIKTVVLKHLMLKLVIITDLTCLRTNEDKAELYNVIESIASENIKLKQSKVNCSDSTSSQTECDALAASDLNTIVLIAGNNGRILKTFGEYALQIRNNLSSLAPLNDNQGNPHNFMVQSEMLNLAKSLEQHMILNKVFRSDFIQLLPLSECLDRDAVEMVFKEVLNDDNWRRCLDCSIHNKCPIYANRRALLQDNVIRHFADLFELAKDDGMHFTVRNLLVVICNAILGNQHYTSDRFYTCLKAEHDVEASFYAPYKFKGDRRSSPFDNLLGLNLNSKQFNLIDKDDDGTGDDTIQALNTPPIFRQLEYFGVGSHSTKLLDDFIVQACIYPGSDAGQMLGDLIGSSDAADIREKLKISLESLQEYSESDTVNDSEVKQATDNMRAYMASMRRILFFTANESLDNAFTDSSGTSTYSLSSLSYAKAYLSFKEFVRHNIDLSKGDENSPPSLVEQLIDGLNRVFTSLSLMKSNDSVYVSSNNIINPAEFCIVPDKDRFVLKFEKNDSDFSNVIRIVRSGLLNDVKDLPTLAYYPKSSYWPELAKQEIYHSNNDSNERSTDSLISEERKREIIDIMRQDEPFIDGYCDRGDTPFEELDDTQKLNTFFNYLETRNNKGKLKDAHKPIYETLSAIFGKTKNNESASDNTKCLSSYSEVSKAYKHYPVVAQKIILTPRLFNYLMAMGAGDSSISFSDECHEELTSFKTRIEAFMDECGDNDEQNDTNVIEKLKFCKIDSDGQIKLE